MSKNLFNQLLNSLSDEDFFVSLQRGFNELYNLPNVKETFNKIKPSLNDDEKYATSSNEKEIIFEFAVPGVKKENVNIFYEDNMLNIEGVDKYERKIHRCIRLNKDRFDFTKTSAKMEDGILIVSIKKKVEEKKSNIKIKVE